MAKETYEVVPPNPDGHFDGADGSYESDEHQQGRGGDHHHALHQTDHDDKITGMQRKWDRHFYGKFSVLGQCCLFMGVFLSVVTGFVWSQFLYTYSFDSYIHFEVIVDRQDQDELHWTYLNFQHRERESQTSLYSVYLFNVLNPREIMEDGYKPKITEQGPYGYVKHVHRYDITFSENDSEYVSYKQYSYFTSTPSLKDCHTMFFRMDLADYSSQREDCPSDKCYCRNDTETATITNPKFFQVLERMKPDGISGLVSRQLFKDVEDSFVNEFLDSVFAHFIPEFFENVYSYRNAVNVKTILSDLINNLVALHGEEWVVQKFTGNHESDIVSHEDCGAINVPLEQSETCPFGTAQFIASLAKDFDSSLTEKEARAILNLPDDPSIPNTVSPFRSPPGDDSSVNQWIRTAIFLEFMELGLVHRDQSVIDENAAAFNYLINECTTWDNSTLAQCRFKITGLCDWLFNMWTESDISNAMVHEEWNNGAVNTVACDPQGTPCGWELGDYYTSFSQSFSRVGKKLNNKLTSMILDSKQQTISNFLNIHNFDNLNNFKDIYSYCKNKLIGKKTDCLAMNKFETLATESYVNYLRDDEFPDITYNSSDPLSPPIPDPQIYTDMACGLSFYLFDGWGKTNSYTARAVVLWFKERWPSYDDIILDENNLENLGYSQWSNGIPTLLLHKVPSVTNIKRNGIWRFASKGYQLKLPEYFSRTVKWGYPVMNLTTTDGKLVLQALADESSNGHRLRTHIIKKGTTFYGSKDNVVNGVGEGEEAYIMENAYADFTLPEDDIYREVSVILNKRYISDPTNCLVVENYYEVCEEEVIKYKRYWPTRCTEWQTLSSDPAFGIQCDETRIWKDPHPHPKRRGNIIESIITEMIWEEIFRKEFLVCDDPNDCDYRKGGMFVTAPARDIIFDGYVEPWTMKVMNMEFSMQNRKIHMECIDRQVKTYDHECTAIYENDCNLHGFNIIHEDYGIIKSITKQHTPADWYWPDIHLPHDLGIIDNPVIAIHSGMLWKNETFLKKKSCANRYINGKDGVFKNCTHVMETGRHSLETIGSMKSFFGNDTLRLAPAGGSIEVNGNQLAEGNYNQFTPFAWEGFRDYQFSYWGRELGNRYLSNESFTVFVGEQLLKFQLDRVEEAKEVAKRPTHLVYPTLFSYYDNNTEEKTFINLVRYEVGQEDWDANGLLTYQSEYDFYGMPYDMPVGMSSTRAASGFPTVVGTPHHYGNAEWGGTEYIQFKGLSPNARKHKFHIDVEPISGQVMRVAKRLQYNLRVERGPLMDRIISSQDRCLVPTTLFKENGFGCFVYMPLMWEDDNVVFETEASKRFEEVYLAVPFTLQGNTFISISTFTVIAILASILWMYQFKRYRTFKQRVFLD